MDRRPPRGRGPRARRGEPRRGEPRRPEPPPEPRPRELVEDLVRRLVPGIQQVEIEEKMEEGVRTVTVSVDEAHLGAVIGRRGRTAQALRALLGAAGAKHRTRIHLEIKG